MKFTASSPVRGNGTPVLPQFVRDYLASGAAEGSRNDTLHKVAQQFFAAGLSIAEAEAQLIQRALADGLSESEARGCIRSGYKSTKVTAPLISAPTVHRVTPAPRKRALGFIDALEAAFKPGESIAVVESRQNDAGEWKPSVPTIKTLERWKSYVEKMGSINALFHAHDGGAFIAINPLRAGAEQRSNDNISSFRHVLAEWDSLPVAEQHERLIASGLPISVIISSGGKSVHGWVRVDAETREQWEQRRDLIHERLGCDVKNKDLARASRCPEARRGDKVQDVLAVNVGARNWAEYEARATGLPGLMTLSDLAKTDPRPTPEIIRGVLNMGCKMIMAGPSKARKSWVLLDLCLSVVLGRPWLGFETTQGRAMYVNLELADWMLWQRVAKIAESRGMAALGVQGKDLSFWNLRGKVQDLRSLTAPLVAAVRSGGFSLVVIDPIYKLMGDADENDAGDIARLMHELEAVCSQAGAALVFGHHFAKGNAGEKSAIDRASGSGVWVRDPDAVMTLTPPTTKKGEQPEEGTMILECILRAHPPVKSCALRWSGYHFERGDRITMHKSGSRAERFGDTLSLMPPLVREAAEEWFRGAADIGSIEEARRVFDTLRRPDYGFLVFEGGLWRGARCPF